MDKITLKDQVGGTKNRVTLVKVDGTANTYDVYADRTGVTQVGDEITAADINQIQDNVEQAIGDATGYDRVIPYRSSVRLSPSLISAPVDPAPSQTAGLCVRIKIDASFDTSCSLGVSTWSAPIAAEESVTGYTPVWPAGIYTFTYDGTAWRLPLPMAASTAYTDTALSDHDHTIRRRYSPALHGTAAGEAVHITDSAAESDFSRLAVIGRSTQDGEPAPDTPIAIAGVQPASVRVCRKNLANIPDKTVSNAAYVGFSDVYSKNAPGVMHMVDKSKIYTLSAYIDNTSGAADSGVKVWYTKNGTVSVFNPVSSVSVPVGSKGAATYVIDLTALNWEEVTGLFPGLDLRGSGEGKTVSASQVQFEAGDAATPFEPYAGTDYPLTLTTPMYSLPGGADEIDLVSGAETRRCGVITLDGTETWMVRKANATSASFITPVSNVAIGAAYPAISTIGFRAGRYGVDGYEGATSDSGTSNRPQISVLYSRIGSSAEDTDADKISKFKAWLASHPVTLVYQLANPVTADHARADIAQPAPEANVSADGAPVDVTYNEIMDDENADLLLTLVSDYAQLKQRVENLEKNGSSGGSDSGQNGDDGATFTPSVSPDGMLSWTNDKGLDNPDPVNIKGPQGPAGADGAKGEKGDVPEKGVDYWTEEDKQEIVDDVLSNFVDGNGVGY